MTDGHGSDQLCNSNNSAPAVQRPVPSYLRYVGTVDCVFVVKAVIQIIPAAAGQGRHLYCSACVVTPERPEMTAHKLPVAWQSNLEVKSTRA